jgi:hypothetical protein
MNSEATLRAKLRKIEALFAGAATDGEKAAAGAAAGRIRDRLGRASRSGEKQVETRFSIPDAWSRQLFAALCRRYGIRPFRYRGMHRQSLVVKASKSFVDQVLLPEFQELNAALVGVTVEVSIVRLENVPDWTLEVVNSADEKAYAEFQRAVVEEGMTIFLENGNVVIARAPPQLECDRYGIGVDPGPP